MRAWHPWPLVLGLAVLLAAWASPLPSLAAGSFTAHMAMHLAVIAVAAPLIAFGLGGGVLDPVRRWPRLFTPLLMATLDLAVVWAWHAPALHHLARHTSAGLVLEQSSFLLVSLAVWLAAFGGTPAERTQRTVGGMAGLLMTSTHMTLLGVLLALAPRALYEHGPAAAFGLSPQQDQELGGVLMLVVGGTSYLAGGLFLLARMLVGPAGNPAPPRQP